MIYRSGVGQAAPFRYISWGLIEHWQSLGILSKSSCNKENIDFETFEWSWNDDIDLLIDWAKCYTLPVLPQNIK